MISAKEALQQCTKHLDLDRMIKITEVKIKEAIAENRQSCCVLFSKHIYSSADIRNFKNEVSHLGYLFFDKTQETGNSFCIELQW